MTNSTNQAILARVVSRRKLLSLCLLSLCASGCTTPWINKEEENPLAKRSKEVEKLLKSDDRPRLIGEAGSVVGLNRQQFESFGLVINLPLTGGDTKPSEAREYVLHDLKVRQVANPNALLTSKTSAIVKLRADCSPGFQSGDRVDLIVQKSMDSEARDLRNGDLMPARLMDFVTLKGQVHQSNLKGLADGPVVSIPASMNSTKQSDPDLGVILGGARLVEEQPVGYRIKDELRHKKTIEDITGSINERFDVYDKNVRKGIATAKSDRDVALSIPAKYRGDIGHFVEVLSAIGFMESSGAKSMRVDQCRDQMKSPTTARRAANQLEAIGKEGIPILKESLASTDPEIRFYAAYSLAFLDNIDAIPALVELSKTESAFRPLTLLGLSVIESAGAEEALRQLLQESEPELCYGALRALRKRKTYDPVAEGQMLQGIGRVTEIASPHPLVAVSLTQEAEIASFGGPIPLSLPDFCEVNPRMTMKNENGVIRLAHFRPGQEDLHSLAEPNLRSILQGMSDVRATYSDVISFLDTAKQSSWITVPVEFNPIPTPGREYKRNVDPNAEAANVNARAWWDVRRLWEN